MSWKQVKCKKCGYGVVMDICGCIVPLCNPPSTNHDWETLNETYDREEAFKWRFIKNELAD